mgnify:CR=1 FL=1
MQVEYMVNPMYLASLKFDGIFLVEDFLTEAEEASLVEQIEADPNWKESQSGRRKIDYGPQVNFKKKKVKVGKFKGLPKYSKTLVLDKIDDLMPKF